MAAWYRLAPHPVTVGRGAFVLGGSCGCRERQTLVILFLSVFIVLLGNGIIIPLMPVIPTESGASCVDLVMSVGVIMLFAVGSALLIYQGEMVGGVDA